MPDTPFPRLNDSKMYIDRIMDAALMVWGEWRARNGEMPQPARQPA